MKSLQLFLDSVTHVKFAPNVKFRAISNSALVTTFAAFSLLCPVTAVAGGKQMKLLSPTTGWTVRGDALYWTQDNGASWADITPVPPGVGRAASKFDNVFFLNAAEGWAITAQAAPAPSPFEDTPSLYSIAHTTNGGTSWTFTPLTYPSAGLEGTTAFPTQLFFIDSLHGWLSITWAGLTHPGRLMATSDGGQTWTWLETSGGSGPIVFATLQDGWQIGNFAQGGLIVTHDGGKNWEQVNPVPPAEAGEAVYPRFQDPPVFKDSRNGHLVVQYIGGPDTPSKLVVYATSDTGRTWRPTKTVSEAEVSGGIISFAIADSSIIVPFAHGAENTKVKTARLDGGLADLGAAYDSVSALDFSDTDVGWMMTTDGLQMTRDGGSTWKNITPGGHRPAFKRTPPVKKINSVGAPRNVAAFQPAAPNAGAQ